MTSDGAGPDVDVGRMRRDFRRREALAFGGRSTTAFGAPPAKESSNGGAEAGRLLRSNDARGVAAAYAVGRRAARPGPGAPNFTGPGDVDAWHVACYDERP